MGEGDRNSRVPPSVYIHVVGIRMGSIEVSNEKCNIAMRVDQKEAHTGGTSLLNDKGLRVAFVSASAPFLSRCT